MPLKGAQVIIYSCLSCPLNITLNAYHLLRHSIRLRKSFRRLYSRNRCASKFLTSKKSLRDSHLSVGKNTAFLVPFSAHQARLAEQSINPRRIMICPEGKVAAQSQIRPAFITTIARSIPIKQSPDFRAMLRTKHSPQQITIIYAFRNYTLRRR